MLISALALSLSLSGLLLVFYTVERILFLTWNHSYISHATIQDILLVFLNGLRFDLNIILLLNLIPICLSFYTHPKILKKHVAFLAGLIFFIHVPFMVLNQIDTEFVNFTSRRFNLGNVGLLAEAQGKLSGFITTYLPLIFVQILISLAFCFFFFKISKYFYKNTLESPLKYYVTFILLLIPFLIIGIRGGIQRKPLNPTHAAIFNESHLNLATLNSTFTMIRERPDTFLKRQEYFQNYQELTPYLNGTTHENSLFTQNLADKKTNVVIIILESFALEYMDLYTGENFTPFLNTLAQKGLFVEETYANGFRSIEAISSIMAGIPSLMLQPFVRSPFFNNPIKGLGTYFTNIGYSTSFFHGGLPGTMFFDIFTKKAGFEKYYSSADYPNPKDSDDIWGIYDEPFLDFMAQELDKTKKPFLSAVFTLSSHHPYKVPGKYKDILPLGKIPILKSISYTDQALKSFFKTASQKDWYANTLFVVTADHTQIPYLPQFKNTLGRFRIPLILYHPNMNMPEINKNRISQHVDILPTLLDMFKIEDPQKAKFGKSIFSPEESSATILYDNTLIYKDHHAIISFLNKEFKFYQPTDIGLQTPEATLSSPDSLLKFKSMIQYYNNGLLENKIYYK